MKALHYSDHAYDQIEPLFDQCDLFITTGDLSIFDFATIREKITTKPSFGVYGNHCIPGYLENLGIENVHLNVVSFNGMTIGGYQGCLRYKERGDFQFTEEEALTALQNFPTVDILLLHAAPFGLLDTSQDVVHTGSHAVREYVERAKPKYIFCGHDSPSLELVHGSTNIFRTDMARMITIQ